VHTTVGAGGHAPAKWSTKITETARPQEFFHEAMARLRAGDAPGAAAHCEIALAAYPDDANILCLAARSNLASQQFDAARQQVEKALALFPDFAAAHDAMGDLRLVEQDADGARSAYERALELEPGRPATPQKLARAQAMAERAGGRRKHPAYADDLRRAARHQRDGERDKAEAIYRKILKADPDHVEASRLLAGVATAHERYREAEIFLKRAVELAPDYVRAWVDLSNVQRHLDRFDDAIASAERVVELAPEQAESYMVLASALGVGGRHDEAIATFERVLVKNPRKTAALCAMGHHLKTVGRTGEAVARYRECIAIESGHGEAWWSLANLKTFRFEDAEIEAMQAQLAGDELDDEARLQVHNALGLALEGRKDHGRAFEHFAACNRIRRQKESYDPVDTESTHDRIIELFDRAFLSQEPGDRVEPAPIFVVGLPRSGSTLIEQILASHSQVEGTHELTDLAKVVREVRRASRTDMRFPEAIAHLKAGGWSKIGKQYLERTAQYRSGAPYFIDKNPNNFVFTGLIRLAMPNAKVINARRHPLDSCLGTFKQLFASGQPFSYDIVELGEYYLQYQRLMDHYHAAMPGFVLDVHYEQVVGDLEGQVRRLLDFCGLPFEESCLRFHETERAVKTASSEQVRRPIYSSSVNLWRNYEKDLGELVEILEPVLLNMVPEDRPKVLQEP